MARFWFNSFIENSTTYAWRSYIRPKFNVVLAGGIFGQIAPCVPLPGMVERVSFLVLKWLILHDFLLRALRSMSSIYWFITFWFLLRPIYETLIKKALIEHHLQLHKHERTAADSVERSTSSNSWVRELLDSRHNGGFGSLPRSAKVTYVLFALFSNCISPIVCLTLKRKIRREAKRRICFRRFRQVVDAEKHSKPIWNSQYVM